MKLYGDWCEIDTTFMDNDPTDDREAFISWDWYLKSEKTFQTPYGSSGQKTHPGIKADRYTYFQLPRIIDLWEIKGNPYRNLYAISKCRE